MSYFVPMRTGIAVFSGSVSLSRDTHLVEPPSLPVPFFHAIQRGSPCEIEHEKDCDGIVGDKRQHGDELALSSKIPDLNSSAVEG